MPVVQPNHGSFPELIEATQGGLLVEPENPTDLAKGLLQVLTDHQLRRELRENGKRAVYERFHAEEMATRTEEELLSFVNQKRQAAVAEVSV